MTIILLIIHFLNNQPKPASELFSINNLMSIRYFHVSFSSYMMSAIVEFYLFFPLSVYKHQTRSVPSPFFTLLVHGEVNLPLARARDASRP